MAKQKGITNQITKYQTDKKLIEFMDFLQLADVESYAKIHNAGGSDKNSYSSRIKLNMLDYSAGTGDKIVTVNFNLTPDDIRNIYEKVQAYYQCVSDNVTDYKFTSEKINNHVVNDGKSPVSKLTISRQGKMPDGSVKRLPWTITIENGTGVAATRENGGIYMKSGSFVSEKKAFIVLTDADMNIHFRRVVNFITCWELTYAPKNIREGKQKLIEMFSDNKNNN